MFYTNVIETAPGVHTTFLLYHDGVDLWSFHEGHRLHDQYLAWLEAGNTPEPWEATNGPV